MDRTAERLLDMLDTKADILLLLLQRGLPQEYVGYVMSARNALREYSASIILIDEVDGLNPDERETLMRSIKVFIRDLEEFVTDIRSHLENKKETASA